MSGAVSEESQRKCLQEMLMCLVCSQNAIQAHCCPNCSRFFCYLCITQWISKEFKCHHCKSELQVKELVNCQNIFVDLYMTLESMNKRKQQKKQQIQQKLHKQLVQLAKQKILKIKQRIKQQKQSVQQAERILQPTCQSIIKTYQTHLQYLKQTITKRFNLENTYFQAFLQKQRLLINENKHFYQENLKFINDCNKAQFINSQANNKHQIINKQIQQLTYSNDKLFKAVEKFQTKTIQSRIIPPYKSHLYQIYNFSQLKQKFYTQIFSCDGLEWRLKIYPLGINPQDKTHQPHISIYIELFKSIRQKGRYRHKLILQNPKQPASRFQREYQSQFQQNQSCGYDDFISRQSIYSDHLINHQLDQVSILLMIAPANYYQANMDKVALISARKQSSINNKLQIQRLKQQLQSLNQ